MYGSLQRQEEVPQDGRLTIAGGGLLLCIYVVSFSLTLNQAVWGHALRPFHYLLQSLIHPRPVSVHSLLA